MSGLSATETALVLPLPEMEAVVGQWRHQHDPSAAQGMPAHMTVLYPFKPDAADDPACLSALQSIMAAAEPIKLTFRAIGRFARVVWLAPEPAEPVLALTQAVLTQFPDYPPYGGKLEAIPHLTVAIGEEADLQRAAAAMTEVLRQPISTTVVSCALFARQEGRWREQRRFPLGAPA